ncbi:MAG: hypothetical protein LBL66_11370, partial [Clostridiales bacterium]|nr:hypothetical protein [Clostridiales bacterium]
FARNDRGGGAIGMTWICTFRMREECARAFPCSVEIAASRFRAPRNDKRGVRAPRNRLVARSVQRDAAISIKRAAFRVW